MEFQKEDIKFGLSRGGRCLLADEMGLGKTMQALAVAAQYKTELQMIVVCVARIEASLERPSLDTVSTLCQSR